MNSVALQCEKIKEAADVILQRFPKPDVAVVLGSGLGALADCLKEPLSLSYTDIPHFPAPTIPGHSGKLICGKIGEKIVYAFSGRFQYYEGHDPWTVILPMRILGKIGCPAVILTNAAGGINETFSPGDLMMITDHINLTGYNPLRGDNCPEWGPRFPDMTQTYDKAYQELALSIAKEMGFSLQKGVYCGFSGPNFETPAEIRMLQILGGSAVGMSTVPEALAAHQQGIRIFAVSCISNMAAGITQQVLTHEEVFETSKRTEGRFTKFIEIFIQRM